MRIALIGAGRLATNLAPALKDAGHDVVQVYSRTQEAAETLAAKVGAKATCSVEEVTTDADVYIFSVSDNALPQLAKTLGKGREDAVFLHTAGSVAMSVFEGVVKHYGVLYPMQTFSKERMVNFKDIPVFVEGSDEQTLTTVRELAETVSTRVMELTSEGRRHLHLAAEKVFFQHEARKALNKALAELSTSARRRLLLHFYKGLSFTEIARREGVSESAVRGQIKSALSRLRHTLEAQDISLSDFRCRSVYDYLPVLTRNGQKRRGEDKEQKRELAQGSGDEDVA